MATTKGIFGQAAPAATTEADLYTVPASKVFTGYVTVCNRSTAASFRISVAATGGATSNEDYLAYDNAIAANESLNTKNITVGATGVIRVYASSANLSFTLTGILQDA